ncbi:MAG: hypothetical protein Ta2A_14670 [Treponemataceae bacterium]|nr:MAG: hypothetical protein Ta2A_14670 [Treponemataceae bacterium]
MKKKQGFLVASAAVLAFCVAAAGCKNDSSGPGIDYGSKNTNYSILVRNNTGEKLVAFKGELDASKIIGGIPAHANNHGLPNKSKLFDKTEDFPMILLTEAQYNANKSNLRALKDAPFTRVYVFYNKSGDNTAVYEIAGGLGGNNTLTIINSSDTLNVELRLNGVAGETIGYAPGGMHTTTLKLNDGNYNIFPVFKRYNAFRDTVDTVYPKNSEGLAWSQSYSFGEGMTDFEMNLKTLLQSQTLTSGVAWVVVNNQTTSGGIRFVEGVSVRKTLTGLENIMPGSSNTKTFQYDMPKVGKTYGDSVPVSNWKFGPVGYEKALQVSADNATLKGSFSLARDKMYTVTVTGSHNDGTLKAWIDNGVAVDTNLGSW